MSACPQCGTVAKPTDKFCNTCGTPVAAARPAPGPAPGPQGAPQYGGAPPPQGYGAPAPGAGGARCQMGHDIAPGTSYCAQGHPIALDAMQFANDAYGGAPQQQAYGQQPPQQGYGGAPQQPPPQYGGYGAAPQPSASPIGGAGGFGAPDPNQQYGGFPQQGQQPYAPQVGGPTPYPGTPAQQGYGGAPQGYDPNQAYGQQPQQGYGGAPQAYPQPGQPQQPVFNPAPAPPVAAPAAAAAPAPAAAPDPNNKTLRGFLVAYGTNPNGDFWPLTGGRLVVGRTGAGDGIDIFLSDPTISSRHAVLVIDGVNGTIVLEDTGSTNGTFVNDDHLGFNGRRDLRDGDRLRFGGFTTVVKVVGRI